MNIPAIILLFIIVILEVLSLLQNNNTLNAYTFILAFGSAGALLLAFARQALDGPYRTGATLIGLGYLVRALGEWGWQLGILNDDNGYSFISNLPYHLTSLFYAFGAYAIYQAVARLLNLGQRSLMLALAGAIGLVLLLSLPALGQGALSYDFWIESFDNVVSASAAFLMIAVAAMTRGGALSRWAQPLGAVFLMFLVGNTVYTLDANNYEYGSLPDYFWIAETLIIMLMVALIGRDSAAEDDF